MGNTNTAMRPALDPAATQNYFNQIRHSFDQLSDALQACDLAGAQIAFAPLTFLTQIAANDAGPAKENSFCIGLAAIGKALKAGDIRSAQYACKNLRLTIHPTGREALRHRSFGN
jgi:hypothetical protein